MNRFSTRRAAVVFLSLGAIFIALIIRVAFLQTLGRRQTLGKAERQQHQTTTLPARRGTIYDRNGFALAITVQKQDLFVDPHFLESYEQDPQNVAATDDAVQKLR